MDDYTKPLAGLGLAFGGFIFLGFSGYPLILIFQSLGLLGLGAGIGFYLTRNKKGGKK